MNIQLGGMALDPRYTQVREVYEEIGGRDARRIEISGIVVGEHSSDDIERRLDAILYAASETGRETELVVRPGRRTKVRRLKYTRELSRDSLVGRYSLTLEAERPYDEAIDAAVVPWTITASGQSVALSTAGNASAPLAVQLVADGDLINPVLSDGVNTLAFTGVVGTGETLAFETDDRRVRLADSDMTPYTTGNWPHVYPGGSSLSFADGDSSSHRAHATVTYRDRWW